MNFFIRPQPVDDPAIRLVVFHHAGGSAAAYFPLARGIPADWDLLLIDLPGRGKRYRSPPLQDMGTLVAVATDDVMAWAGAPIALFGHSLGAVLAAEVARSMTSRGAAPVWAGVSGRAPPGQPVGRRLVLPDLSDEELMRQLTETGGMPDRINELPEFRSRFLQLVRSDLRAADSYCPDPERDPLTVPLTAFGATDDPLAPPSSMVAWGTETCAGFRHRVFAGGHFYLLGSGFKRFTEVLVEEIRSAQASPGRPVTEKVAGPGRRV